MNSNDSEKAYQNIMAIKTDEAIEVDTFSKSISLFIRTGHTRGLGLALAKASDGFLKKIGESSLLLNANSFEVEDVSADMVGQLVPYYDSNSLNLNVATKQAIMNGRIDNACRLIAHSSQEIKNESLELIISAHEKSEDSDLKSKIVHIFDFLTHNGADLTFRDFHLYNHALNHKSNYFISYFCEKYPDVVKSRRSTFCSFCAEPKASNKMVEMLINAGASLSWLSKDHWTRVLRNQKIIYMTEGLSAKEYSAALLECDKERAIDHISAEAIDEFVYNTIPLFFDDKKRDEASDANTLTNLLMQGVIDSHSTLRKFIEFKGEHDADEMEFIYRHMNIKNKMLLAVMVTLALKTGRGTSIFRMIKEDKDEYTMIYFSRIGLEVQEFANELTEYISIYPRLVEIIS